MHCSEVVGAIGFEPTTPRSRSPVVGPRASIGIVARCHRSATNEYRKRDGVRANGNEQPYPARRMERRAAAVVAAVGLRRRRATAGGSFTATKSVDG